MITDLSFIAVNPVLEIKHGRHASELYSQPHNRMFSTPCYLT